ncbi:MAG: sodium/solute symporter [Fuerstiella sp.]|nr:sodium/solute symporter [Fuerstiella sp.]
MHVFDHIVVAAYLLIILGFGIACGRGQSRKEFFAAGGSMGWFVVGLSVMATLFSSNSFVMYPSAAFGSSLRVGLTLVAVTLMAPVVVWVFIPVYSRLNCETAYEYLERRFHVSVRCLASGLFILLRIGWMASATFAASLVIASVAGISQNVVILSLGVIAILYTMLGGLRAVMWTDVLQFFIFTATILVSVALLISNSESGVAGIANTYFHGREGLVFDFTPLLTLKYGSWAVLIGVFLEALSAFGADQVAVQRYLSAQNERTSQLGFGLNLLGMWIVIPGLLAIGVGLYSYFENHPEQLRPVLQAHYDAIDKPMPATSSDEIGDAMHHANLQDKALPQFVRLHFPPGMAGLFLAALMAAVMSSIDSGIHSVTTAIVVDFRDRLRPNWKPDDPARDVFLIRMLILLVGTLSVTLACFVGPLGDVFEIGKKTTAAFGGPLLAVFLLALFSKHTTSRSVFTATLLSACITMLLMYNCEDWLGDEWFAVWYWPIGFGLTFVLVAPLNFALRHRSRSTEPALTYRQVMKTFSAKTDPTR